MTRATVKTAAQAARVEKLVDGYNVTVPMNTPVSLSLNLTLAEALNLHTSLMTAVASSQEFLVRLEQGNAAEVAIEALYSCLSKQRALADEVLRQIQAAKTEVAQQAVNMMLR